MREAADQSMTALHDKWSRFWTMARTPMSTQMPVVRVLWTFGESMKRPDILLFAFLVGGMYVFLSVPPIYPYWDPLGAVVLPMCVGIVVGLTLLLLGAMRTLQTGVVRDVSPMFVQHVLRVLLVLLIILSLWGLYSFAQNTAASLASYRPLWHNH